MREHVRVGALVVGLLAVQAAVVEAAVWWWR